MAKKRFEDGVGDKGLLIYDNTCVDDYYFINDQEERTKFIDLINSIEDEWKEKYDYVLGKYKKQLDLNNEKNREITQLKKEVLSWMSIAICETSSYISEELDAECQRLFNSNYNEATKKIGDADSMYGD